MQQTALDKDTAFKKSDILLKTFINEHVEIRNYK